MRGGNLDGEGIDILIGVVDGPVADHREEEDIAGRGEAVDFHELHQPVVGFFRMEEVGAFCENRAVESGGADEVAGVAAAFFAGAGDDGRGVLEFPGEEILFGDDPAGGLIFAEGVGEDLSHMLSADADGIKAAAAVFRDGGEVHAAGREIFQEDLIHRQFPAMLEPRAVDGHRTAQFLGFLDGFLTACFLGCQDFDDFLPGTMLEEIFYFRDRYIEAP